MSLTLFEILSSLPSHPDARELISIHPYLGIVWDDESLDGAVLRGLSEAEQLRYWRLFVIREGIWRRAELTPADRELWKAAKAAAPDHGLFQRLTRSAEELAEDEREMIRALE